MAAPRDELAKAFLGREAELALLRRAWGQARTGRPQVVLISGAAGIGKTALVDRFLHGETDVEVLRISGEPWEALVPYGVIDQLLRAAGGSRAAFLAERERSLPVEESSCVGGWILELLAALDNERPVVLVVDNAHWADLDSLRALLFALRRLIARRVLTLLTVRSEDIERLPDGLRRLAAGPTGASVELGALEPRQILTLATSLGLTDFTYRSAQRLCAHTGGNPLHVRALLSEVPAQRWRDVLPVWPAPRAFRSRIIRRLESCGPDARSLVEAAAVLGDRPYLATASALGEVAEPLAALAEAAVVDLLQPAPAPDLLAVMFPHPLVRAAVYDQLGPLRRARLHSRAAPLLDDEGAALRHRVAAADAPDPHLAAELEEFGHREARNGAWASAAGALLEASRLSTGTGLETSRLLRAVDAMVSAGDLGQAIVFAREIMGLPVGALRNGALGYLAVVDGRPIEAENLLRRAWELADPGREPDTAATIAQRLALHAIGRLDGPGVVEWTQRASKLAPTGEPAWAEAQAVLGLGLAWQGRLADGLVVNEAALATLDGRDEGALAPRIRLARGMLLLAENDVLTGRGELMETAPAALSQGSVRIALWAYSWLALADFAVGAWDLAALNAERAVTLLGASGHAWLRPLVRWAATVVPAARGDWVSAEEHVRLAAAHTGDYELMIVGSALARAQLMAARGDNGGVLRALEPLTAVAPRDAVDEQGFWPWQDLYGEALVGAGLLDEAELFIASRLERARQGERRVDLARLARVQGRLESARGNPDEAESAFQVSLRQLGQLPLPFDRALVELAYGQVLRRHGKRRAAAAQLQAAADRFAALQARPYLERCERELIACGLAPTERRSFDPTRLTAQELAVARLVADGLSNRQVAAELFVSVKTVQFHLTHIYAKLAVSSRAELAARLREDGTDAVDHSGRH